MRGVSCPLANVVAALQPSAPGVIWEDGLHGQWCFNGVALNSCDAVSIPDGLVRGQRRRLRFCGRRHILKVKFEFCLSKRVFKS